MMADRIKITLKRSTIGRLGNQKNTVKALGLKRIGSSVEQDNSEVIQGMVSTVKHLVEVESISGDK